jgi:hypothetical protein
MLTVLPLRAQQRALTTLTGIVFGSTGEPLATVQILLDATRLMALSDENGSFQVDSVTPGAHTLTLSKPGFQVQTYRFTLPEIPEPVIDLGAIVLEPQRESFASLSGVVVDSMTVEPVAAAQLKLDQDVVGLSDANGSFDLEQVRAGFHTLEVRRIGYEPTYVDFEILTGQPMVSLIVKMKSLPTQLPEVTIEGEGTVYATGKLREFYQRAQSGFGHFITRSQIEERSARVSTDLLYGVPGLQVTPGQFGRNSVRLSRATMCGTPVVFLDGVKIHGSDLDEVVNPQDIVGIEIYTRASNVPPVFNIQGAGACGVIAVWTR